jgi:hypothetical protein
MESSSWIFVEPLFRSADGRYEGTKNIYCLMISNRYLQLLSLSALTLTSVPCKVQNIVLSHADCPISRTALPPRSRASDSPVSAASTPEYPGVDVRAVTLYCCLWRAQ